MALQNFAAAAGAFLLVVGTFGCASRDGGNGDTPSARLTKEPCPAPELVSEEERRALRLEAVVVTESEGHRLECGGALSAPHWVSLPVEGAAMICVDRRGVVYDVTTEQSTGDQTYDKMLRIELRTWRYLPLVRDGKPMPYCYRLPMRIDESSQR